MRILPDGLVPDQTGVISWLEAHADRFNLYSRTNFNVRDEEYGADHLGVIDAAPAFTDAYTDAKVAGGTVVIPPGTYRIESDLAWDSNLVSVEGAGSNCTVLQLVGTAKIVARPNPFTVDQGPEFSGFTVVADPASPAGATGAYSGDITSSEWTDVVFQGFNGAGSIGLHLDNATAWTELNKFRRMRFHDCTVGIKCSVSASTSNSFARNRWDVHFNLVGDDQIGFQATDDALLYGNKGSFDGNALGNDGVFVDFLGTSSMSGLINMDFEQTTGTGAVGVREALVGFQMMCDGVRNYSQTMPEDRGGGAGGGGLEVFNFVGGFRMREGVGARQGIASLSGGTATVLTTAVKDIAEGQRIYLTRQLANPAQPRGFLEVGARSAGTSFVINSMDAAGALTAEQSVVAWLIVEKY